MIVGVNDTSGIEIRRLVPSDSLESLTDLLHRAYQQLGDMGLRYFATYQSVDDTRSRIADGNCYVACLDSKIIGTITWTPGPATREDMPPIYRRAEVARFGQFGVAPAHQRRGIGGRMLRLVERDALNAGFEQLALDTAEPAAHLIDWYRRLGFKSVGHWKWGGANYRSVLMSKTLGHPQE
jgi:GNAT superfamily N-acetyltransferase